jgi:hypothetical protein
MESEAASSEGSSSSSSRPHRKPRGAHRSRQREEDYCGLCHTDVIKCIVIIDAGKIFTAGCVFQRGMHPLINSRLRTRPAARAHARTRPNASAALTAASVCTTSTSWTSPGRRSSACATAARAALRASRTTPPTTCCWRAAWMACCVCGAWRGGACACPCCWQAAKQSALCPVRHTTCALCHAAAVPPLPPKPHPPAGVWTGLTGSAASRCMWRTCRSSTCGGRPGGAGGWPCLTRARPPSSQTWWRSPTS